MGTVHVDFLVHETGPSRRGVWLRWRGNRLLQRRNPGLICRYLRELECQGYACQIDATKFSRRPKVDTGCCTYVNGIHNLLRLLGSASAMSRDIHISFGYKDISFGKRVFPKTVLYIWSRSVIRRGKEGEYGNSTSRASGIPSQADRLKPEYQQAGGTSAPFESQWQEQRLYHFLPQDLCLGFFSAKSWSSSKFCLFSCESTLHSPSSWQIWAWWPSWR